MPQCSIIIPVYNHASVTRQCLNTLLGQPTHTDMDVVVVDDASSDETSRVLAGYGDKIRVVTHAANAGFATSCNHGGMVASGEFLVFLNNDTIARPGWLDALVACARRHPRAAIVGAKLLFPNDTVQHAGVAFSPPTGLPMHLYYGWPADHPVVNKTRRMQAVTGACMLIRREVFAQLGGFDPLFFNVYEDVDLCLRAGELGHEVYYCPDSVLYHLQSITRHEDARRDPVKGTEHSLHHLYSRWRNRVHSDELRFYEADGLLAIGGDTAYPRQLILSPLVATVERTGHEADVDRLIALRSRQVGELIGEKIRRDVRVGELEQHVFSAASPTGATLPSTWPGLRASLPMLELRNAVAGLYLEGSGLEVGALHSPIKVAAPASVRYVDRMTVAELRRQYPELDALPLVEPDIIDDGERLSTVADASQDFLIASHFLEHCQDPIGTVETMLRVVRPGGVLFLAVPDKRYTFDHRRPVTTLDHLIRDHEEGPAWSRTAHFEEWATLADDANIKGRSAQQLMDFDYSIHFHVWTQAEILELFAAMRTRYALDFEIEVVVRNAIEVMIVLRKGAVA